jgi:alpha-tubulin suppressor-like RCC1 family protein
MPNNYKKGRLGYLNPPPNTCFVCIFTGDYASFALSNSGILYATGCNCCGALGDGTTTNRCCWVPVCGGYRFKTVINTVRSVTALDLNGVAYSWGYNYCGMLGVGDTTDRCQPTPVCCNYTYTCIDRGVGSTTSIGLKTDGTAVTWGQGICGQLGNGSTADQYQPVAVCCNYTYCKLVKAGSFTVGIKTDGCAVAWGNNSAGQLGDGSGCTYRSQPVAVCCNYTYTNIKVGYDHTLGLKTDGCAVAWGSNGAGQLGNFNYNVNSSQPVAVCCNYTYCKIFAHDATSYGIKTDGCAVAWGSNADGQLGDGMAVTSCDIPVAVCCNYTYTDMKFGLCVVFGLKTDQTLVAWGCSSQGALGIGSCASCNKPIAVCCNYTYSNISIKYYSVLGFKTNGTMVSWGNNSAGQLGDGTITCRTQPVNTCSPF